MKAPYLTNKVRRGLWLIVARSPTVLDAEVSDSMDREERECINAAAAYAEYHFKGEKADDVEE